MKRVLHLCLRPLEADDTGLFSAISEAFTSSEFSVFTAYVLSSPQGAKEDFSESGGSTTSQYFFNFPSSAMKGLRLKIIGALLLFLKKHPADIIITHGFKLAFVVALVDLFHPIQRKIVVFHGKTAFRRTYQRIFAKIFMKSFTLVAVSQGVKEFLLTQKAGFNPHQIQVIPNAIHLENTEKEQLSSLEARSILQLPPNAFIFGTIARLVPCKGLKYLMDAFAIAPMPEAHWVLIGDGRERGFLEEQLKHHPMKERIHFLGAIPKAWRYMKAFDVFVLPSIEEGFGMVFLEAMAAKLPIITTQTVGAMEVFGPLDPPLPLCPIKDKEALLRAMENIYNASFSFRKICGEKGYERLCEGFTILPYQAAFRKLCHLETINREEIPCS